MPKVALNWKEKSQLKLSPAKQNRGAEINTQREKGLLKELIDVAANMLEGIIIRRFIEYGAFKSIRQPLGSSCAMPAQGGKSSQ